MSIAQRVRDLKLKQRAVFRMAAPESPSTEVYGSVSPEAAERSAAAIAELPPLGEWSPTLAPASAVEEVSSSSDTDSEADSEDSSSSSGSDSDSEKAEVPPPRMPYENSWLHEERQAPGSLTCAVHAVNHVLQKAAHTPEEWVDFAKEAAADLREPLRRHVHGSGNNLSIETIGRVLRTRHDLDLHFHERPRTWEGFYDMLVASEGLIVGSGTHWEAVILDDRVGGEGGARETVVVRLDSAAPGAVSTRVENVRHLPAGSIFSVIPFVGDRVWEALPAEARERVVALEERSWSQEGRAAVEQVARALPPLASAGRGRARGQRQAKGRSRGDGLQESAVETAGAAGATEGVAGAAAASPGRGHGEGRGKGRGRGRGKERGKGRGLQKSAVETAGAAGATEGVAGAAAASPGRGHGEGRGKGRGRGRGKGGARGRPAAAEAKARPLPRINMGRVARSKERCRARGFASGRRPVEGSYVAAPERRVGGGGQSKKRSLPMEDLTDDDPVPDLSAPPDPLLAGDLPPVGDASAPLSAPRDPPLVGVPSSVEGAGDVPVVPGPPPPERLLRPAKSRVPYTASKRRVEHLARQGLKQRCFVPAVFERMSYSQLVELNEELGFFLPRPSCGVCDMAYTLPEKLRVRKVPQEVELPSGKKFGIEFERGCWVCCGREVPVLQNNDLFSHRLSLRQSMLILWHWARPQEPSTDELALLARVHHKSLVEGFVKRVRDIVGEFQEYEDAHMQLGGSGVDVEIDEVSFRARAVRKPDGSVAVEWHRWLCAAQRGSPLVALRPLPPVLVKGKGQGGGKLSDQELQDAVLGGPVELLRPGSVIHTDSAAPYANLNAAAGAWATNDEVKAWLGEQLGEVQSSWRLETLEEAIERQASEKRVQDRRSAGVSAAYRHLRLATTMVFCLAQKRFNSIC